MTVVLHDANTIRLIGACPAEDGETLLQQLLANPMAQVDWRGCESAHAAVIQVLLVSGQSTPGTSCRPVPAEVYRPCSCPFESPSLTFPLRAKDAKTLRNSVPILGTSVENSCPTSS